MGEKIASLLMLAAACTLMGCTGMPTASQTTGSYSDEEIIDAVTSRLSDDDITGRSTFGVQADGGVITINGAVHTEQVRHRVLAIASSTPGVVEVVDRLNVW